MADAKKPSVQFQQLLDQLLACHLQELGRRPEGEKVEEEPSSPERQITEPSSPGLPAPLLPLQEAQDSKTTLRPGEESILPSSSDEEHCCKCKGEAELPASEPPGRDEELRTSKCSAEPPLPASVPEEEADGVSEPSEAEDETPGQIRKIRTDSKESVPLAHRKSMTINRNRDGDLIFSLRALWDGQAIHHQKSLSSPLSPRLPRAVTKNLQAFQSESSSQQTEARPLLTCIAPPGSRSRFLWELLGGALVLYDSINIPLGIFDPPETLGTQVMDTFALLFWTLNVPATLTQGYYSAGKVVMDPSSIAINYLKTWFWLDAVTILPDWIFTLLFAGSAESVKVLRMLRMMRCIRMLRLLKLNKLVDSINDYLDTEYSSICFSIGKMVFLLLMLNHMVACIWFACAVLRMNTDGMTWVEVHKMTRRHVAWEYQYLTSIHWSLTQFTPASMDIQPQNELERLFAIVTLVFALVGFSYVVGSITNSITQLRHLAEQQRKDIWMLRRFLKQNSVPKLLSLRIQKFVEFTYAEQKNRMSIGQVAILSMLSDQLTEELMCAINLPVMNVHPLLSFLHDVFKITMNRLAKEAVARLHMARGDTLFLPDQLASGTYFVSSGRLMYLRALEGDVVDQEYVDATEDWVSEHILWTAYWYHVGTCIASTECEVLVIKPKEFEETLAAVKPVVMLVGEYGRRFMQWVQQSETGLNDVIQGDKEGDFIRSLIPGEEDMGQEFARAKQEMKLSVEMHKLMP